MEDFGNTTQRETDQAQWNVIDALRDKTAMIEQTIAVIQNEQQRQREQNDKLMILLSQMNGKIDLLAIEIAEARGGLKLGRWIAGTAVAVVSATAAALTYVKAG